MIKPKIEAVKSRYEDHAQFDKENTEPTNMGTADDYKAVYGDRPMDYLPVTSVDEIPTIIGPGEILHWFEAFVKAGFEGAGLKYEDSTIHQLNEIALVQVQTTMAWEHMFWKGGLPDTYNEALFFAESTMLEMTNQWWLDNKNKVYPIIVSCKHSMQVVNNLDMIMQNDKIDPQVFDMMLTEYRKRMDFLPWLIFVATSNMSAYLQARVTFGKYACMHTNDIMLSRYGLKIKEESERPKGEPLTKSPEDLD